jgi:single-stranded-DNA-specific exonuclease
MQVEAEEHLEALAAAASAGAAREPALCLFDARWHEGIVGLVASRMKERTGRPVIAFAPGEEPGMLKGSARSVDGVHVRDALADAAAAGVAPGMVFGGHAMAAGVRLPAAELEAFSGAFRSAVARQLALTEPDTVLWTDGPLAPAEIGLGLAEVLHLAGPWGQGFPEPLFDNEFAVLDQRLLKDAHLRLSLRHPAGGEPVEAIAFNERRSLPARARFLYRLGVNDYGGRRRGQLVVEHIHCD